MPAPAELHPSASPLAFFGAELRKYRQRAGVSQEDLADKINFSASLIGFVERAQRFPSRDFVERCDGALELSGELVRLWPLLTREASPPWFHGWLDVEQQAHRLRTWQPLVVPGLLQTEEYARAVIRGEPCITEEQVEKKLEARMERQAILKRAEPPVLQIVIDECVLLRPIGGKDVIRGQLQSLLEAVESPRISIQVVPLLLGGTPGISGGFVIAQLHGRTDTVYIESATHGYVTSHSEDVDAIHSRYDAIRLEAHPQHASIDRIREAVRAWS
ncbi:helix-turn-helix transcriptional regulator [Sphaerisporangium sp. NPDC051011]|uniref:helix-turn-helix domain-containing protein n=1 Tax=Sphaerisporangium sp. NPDC051011 TaxID=3155792 RepID=UPI0033F1ECAD